MKARVVGVVLLLAASGLISFGASQASAGTPYATGIYGGNFPTVTVTTFGLAPRSGNTLYHDQPTEWYLYLCTSWNSNCYSPVHCANSNPCSDGRNCSYCYAEARNVNDNTQTRWDAFWS